MNFDDLHAFVVLHQLKSFSNAAAAVHLSQSALSKRMHGLEEELHIQLIDTTDRRHIHITEAGEHLYEHALVISREVDRLQQDMVDLHDLNVGTLRIGAVPVLSQYGVTQMINHFGEQYPRLNLRVFEQEGSVLINQLAGNELDLAFLRSSQSGMLHDATYVKVPLTSDQLVAIMDAANPLGRHRTVTAKELRGHDVVSLLPGSGVYEPMMTFYQQAQYEPKVVFSSPHIETLVGMLAGSDRVCFLFGRSFAPFATDAVVSRPLQPAVTTELQMVYKMQNRSKAVTDFVDYVREQFGV
ncbi:LysR family transcriptional regulator [Lacticaseibacillus thailandensis]|uniref:Transcriptional regulator LysR family n=1 Tax=Lacticaseibacillus thailandensis DSM 22698 = JCM 13996 TaxID=1423810 RepID=A0A0R2CHS6_9LACO|nr:LysR family transcriptional regulator [Lacticaseibacillus thailandensis]KRM87219.1 transcriptional regulator LysR family [Lacticaseibacillus thailandensis DSM 22698 = JCM 13996]